MNPRPPVDAERFRALVEATTDWVWEVGSDLAYTYVGPQIRDILGYAPEEVLGKSPWDLMDPEEAVRVGAEFGPIAEARRPFSGLVNRNRHKDGRIVVLETSGVPRFDADGHFVGYLGTDRDITAVIDQRERLQQIARLESVAHLAGGVARDFRDLFTSILALSQAQIESRPDDDPLIEDLVEVRRAALRGDALIEQLLSFARRTPSAHAPIRLGAVVREAVGLVRTALPSDVRVDLVVDDESLTVQADAGQLHQVVMNLCLNAKDALEGREGQIHLLVTALDCPTGRLLSHGDLRPGAWAMIRVSDNGAGILPEYLEHLFEPFFTTRPPGEGTGLGLAAVHGIVADHQGAVDVWSIRGKGSRFEVLLPRADVVAAPRSADAIPRGHERVLLVDDDPLVLRSMSRFLSTLGYQVRTEAHPDDALATVLESPEGYDLVICDLLMPRQSGETLAAAIHDAAPHLPIALHTGWAQKANPAQLAKHGVVSMLRKPMAPEAFAREVRRILDHAADERSR